MNTSDDQQRRGVELPLQIDTTAPPERAVATDLVLAWARDCATGEPRYVCELGAERNGKRSGCECYSCGQQLLAINNTKRTFQAGEKRPHFRHPEGTAKESCMVLSARAAALQLLISQGYLELPSRRRSFTVSGLSGSFYDAWVEQPPERVTFRHVEICDQAHAVLRLDDGRVLEVVLAGMLQAREASESEEDHLVPAIYLIVDDPHVAAMPPEELRSRLDLSVANAVWCRHWHDEALRRQAEEAAREKARASLDWLGGDDDVDFPEGTGADEKRETLLHLKAKEILERERRLALPSFLVTDSAVLPDGTTIVKTQELPREMVALEAVELERGMGAIRPDVCAKVSRAEHFPAGPLVIEVTVTHGISGERLARIRAQGLAALEIDVSRMGGRVTEAEFAKLVVDEVAAKRWLRHPHEETLKARVRELLDREVEAARAREIERAAEARRLKEIRGANLDECRLRFLDAAERYFAMRRVIADQDGDPEAPETVSRELRERVETLAYDYRFRQIREIFTSADLPKILERVVCIWSNRCLGTDEKTVGQLLSDIRSEQPSNWQWHTIYLIAVRAYGPTLTEKQVEMVAAWREKVLASLRQGEKFCNRPDRYDGLLAALFPEMADSLHRPLPSSPPQDQAHPVPPEPRVRRPQPSPTVGGWLETVYLSTANRGQWESCGVRNWKAVLQAGEGFRSRGIPVALALQQYARTAGVSEALIFGIWASAKLVKSSSV